MQIFCKSLDHTITIDVNPTDTIYTLKSLIEYKDYIPSQFQRLIFSGKQLNDNNLVSHYNIVKDSTVHLVSSLNGGRGHNKANKLERERKEREEKAKAAAEAKKKADAAAVAAGTKVPEGFSAQNQYEYAIKGGEFNKHIQISKSCNGFDKDLIFFKDYSVFAKIDMKNRGCIRSHHGSKGGWKQWNNNDHSLDHCHNDNPYWFRIERIPKYPLFFRIKERHGNRYLWCDPSGHWGWGSNANTSLTDKNYYFKIHTLLKGWRDNVTHNTFYMESFHGDWCLHAKNNRTMEFKKYSQASDKHEHLWGLDWHNLENWKSGFSQKGKSPDFKSHYTKVDTCCTHTSQAVDVGKDINDNNYTEMSLCKGFFQFEDTSGNIIDIPDDGKIDTLINKQLYLITYDDVDHNGIGYKNDNSSNPSSTDSWGKVYIVIDDANDGCKTSSQKPNYNYVLKRYTGSVLPDANKFYLTRQTTGTTSNPSFNVPIFHTKGGFTYFKIDSARPDNFFKLLGVSDTLQRSTVWGNVSSNAAKGNSTYRSKALKELLEEHMCSDNLATYSKDIRNPQGHNCTGVAEEVVIKQSLKTKCETPTGYNDESCACYFLTTLDKDCSKDEHKNKVGCKNYVQDLESLTNALSTSDLPADSKEKLTAQITSSYKAVCVSSGCSNPDVLDIEKYGSASTCNTPIQLTTCIQSLSNENVSANNVAVEQSCTFDVNNIPGATSTNPDGSTDSTGSTDDDTKIKGSGTKTETITEENFWSTPAGIAVIVLICVAITAVLIAAFGGGGGGGGR